MGKNKRKTLLMKLLFLILLLGVVYTNSLDRDLQALLPKKCNLSKNGRCGPKYGNTICPAGYCSKWWWCGTSALHKSTHQAKYDAQKRCQAKKVVKKAKVGIKIPKIKVAKRIKIRVHHKCPKGFRYNARR